MHRTDTTIIATQSCEPAGIVWSRAALSGWRVVATLFVLFGAGHVVRAAQPVAQPTSRPARPLNVLFISIDDVAANLHSVNGNPGPLRSPNIERLGQALSRAMTEKDEERSGAQFAEGAPAP